MFLNLHITKLHYLISWIMDDIWRNKSFYFEVGSIIFMFNMNLCYVRLDCNNKNIRNINMN